MATKITTMPGSLAVHAKKKTVGKQQIAQGEFPPELVQSYVSDEVLFGLSLKGKKKKGEIGDKDPIFSSDDDRTIEQLAQDLEKFQLALAGSQYVNPEELLEKVDKLMKREGLKTFAKTRLPLVRKWGKNYNREDAAEKLSDKLWNEFLDPLMSDKDQAQLVTDYWVTRLLHEQKDAERKKKVLAEQAQNILSDSKLPGSYNHQRLKKEVVELFDRKPDLIDATVEEEAEARSKEEILADLNSMLTDGVSSGNKKAGEAVKVKMDQVLEQLETLQGKNPVIRDFALIGLSMLQDNVEQTQEHKDQIRLGVDLLAQVLHYGGLEKVLDNRKLQKSQEFQDATGPQKGKIILERLGPVFIKAFQTVSTVPGLFPASTQQVLKTFYEDVSPLPFDTVNEIIQNDLNLDKQEGTQRAYVDPEYLKAGSIAQVHKGHVMDYDPKKVKEVVEAFEGIDDNLRQHLIAAADEPEWLYPLLPGLDKYYSHEVYGTGKKPADDEAVKLNPKMLALQKELLKSGAVTAKQVIFKVVKPGVQDSLREDFDLLVPLIKFLEIKAPALDADRYLQEFRDLFNNECNMRSNPDELKTLLTEAFTTGKVTDKFASLDDIKDDTPKHDLSKISGAIQQELLALTDDPTELFKLIDKKVSENSTEKPLLKALKVELDKIKGESDKLISLKEIYKAKKDLAIPEVMQDYTGKNVLCMEFINGESMLSFEGDKEVAKGYLDLILDQVFLYGACQADPHPGNILYDKDTKTYGFIDAGLAYSVPDPEDRVTFTKLLVALFVKDAELLAEVLIPTELHDTNEFAAFKAEVMKHAPEGGLTDFDYTALAKFYWHAVETADEMKLEMNHVDLMLFKTLFTAFTTALTLHPDAIDKRALLNKIRKVLMDNGEEKFANEVVMGKLADILSLGVKQVMGKLGSGSGALADYIEGKPGGGILSKPFEWLQGKSEDEKVKEGIEKVSEAAADKLGDKVGDKIDDLTDTTKLGGKVVEKLASWFTKSK